ncbi:AMP-binding protein [Streptomyces xanthophaeus]|uniref:AMP-binding protein n=1 Tax=Streptomyces xanthophaeus TaxID=67385 RepID=UPI00364DDB45
MTGTSARCCHPFGSIPGRRSSHRVRCRPRRSPASAYSAAPCPGRKDCQTLHEPVSPAHVEGPSLKEEPARTLGDALRHVTGPAHGLGGDLTWPGLGETFFLGEDGRIDRQSYAELRTEAQTVLGGLRRSGARVGDHVVLQLAGQRAFVTGLWACVLGGLVAVPVAVPSHYGTDRAAAGRLEAAWRLLGNPWLLTDGNQADGLRSLTVRRGRPDLRIAVLDELLVGQNGHSGQEWHRAVPEDPVLVLLTSGSTGAPKGVRLSHGNILTHAAAGRQHHEQTDADIWFNWLPLDHAGGVIMSHLRNVIVGCRQIHAPTAWVLAEPLRWLDALHEHRATMTWAPNFAFGLVSDRLAEGAGSRGWDLSCVRIVLNGGEAVVGRTARRFTGLLHLYGMPTTAMRPVWGMSETSSGQIDGVLTRQDSGTGRGQLEPGAVSVGRPYPGFALRIVDERHNVVAEGTVGALQVRGPAVTLGYHGQPAGAAFTEDGWLDTGDLGIVEEGELTLAGRAKDIIIVNGVNHACHELEALVEDLEEVERSFTAACAVRTPDSSTDELALFFHLKDGADPGRTLNRIRETVLQGAGINPAHLIPVAREDVPKTDLGKIQRARLRELFESGALAVHPPHPAPPPAAAMAAHPPSGEGPFHRPSWEPAASPPPTALEPDLPERGMTLLLADRHGLAQELGRTLRERGQACAIAVAGTSFAVLGPDRFVLPPGRRGTYEHLLGVLAGRGRTVTRVVHLRTYGPYQGEPTAQSLESVTDESVHCLAEAAAALARFNPGRAPRGLFVFASHSQYVHDGDLLAYERAPATAMVKSLAQEVPWLSCRHVDLPFTDPRADALTVLEELRTPVTEEGGVELAHRSGRRLVRRLTPIDTTGPHAPETSAPSGPAGPSGPAFRPGGLYVVSGGLGALAVETAHHLLDAHGVRLLLLGRTQLPPAAAWDEHIAAGSDLGRKLASLRRLRTLGEVHYRAADITDAHQVRAAVAAAQEVCQTRLSGALHLAGHYDESPIAEETPEQRSVVLHAKTRGAFVLHQLLQTTPDALFLSFSSTGGFLGGPRIGAYSAANAFLDALSVHQRTRCHMQASSLAWSMWDNLGISRDYPFRDLVEAHGHRILSPTAALQLLEPALRTGVPHVLIGADPRRPGPAPVRKAAPASAAAPARSTPAAAGTVRTLTGIWCALLNREHITPHENFFALGGQSLLASRMLAQIREHLGIQLTFQALYADPTIAGLARHLADTGRDPGGVLLPIRPEGSLPPLFCIHPASGTAWSYAALLDTLAPDRPLYGLQARGLTGHETLASSIEEMAADYTTAIHSVHSGGPCHLLGASFGGLVAHAITSLLQQAGQRTGVLAVLDTWPPSPDSSPSPDHLEQLLLRVLLRDAGCTDTQGTRPGTRISRSEVATLLQGAGSTLTGLGTNGVDALVRIMHNSIRLQDTWSPPRVQGSLLHFTATDRLFTSGTPAAAWKPYVTGRVTSHDVDCAHVDMFQPGPVQQIGRTLETALTKADHQET